MTDSYDSVYGASQENPQAFWGEAAKLVHWSKEPTTILDDSKPPFLQWFADGETNACYNALDRHVADGRAEQDALIYDSPVTDTKLRFSYRELLERVSKFAGALRAEGIAQGARVIIYMPMVPEAAIPLLPCTRIGALPSVVFGGCAANERPVSLYVV